MRLYADINRVTSNPNDFIIQVGPTPVVGTNTPVNGKFVIEVPEGVAVPNPIPSTVTGLLDGIYQGLLGGYTSFNFVQYNALISDADSDLLDLTALFPYDPGPPVKTWGPRVQVGRFGAPSANGLAPNSVKILPANLGVVPSRPGCVVTKKIDISGDVPAGASSFMVYWKILSLSTTEDVADGSAPGADNTPAIRVLQEVDQEPADFDVYLSTNGGGGYTRVNRLRSVATVPGTDIRLAFVNRGTENVYLSSYAVLY